MAERHLAASLAGSGNLEAALKLLGDVRLCYYSAPPSLPGQASNQSSPMTTAQEYLDAALNRSVLLLVRKVVLLTNFSGPLPSRCFPIP